MTLNEDALEQQLLILGREELRIEQNIKLLRESGREASREGRLDDADAIACLVEALRPELASLQTEIMQVERQLYGVRRRKR